ncbi:MAG: hypothetical protein NC432_02290 [Roseburia sp.]|nr:hypothetical protein [Roseburia sp.]MCM1097479.1 hypothetical protein [Ruminococcus flavefaciens]
MGYETENKWGELTTMSIDAFFDFDDRNVEDRNAYIRTPENYITFPEGLKNFINRKYGSIPEDELSRFIDKCGKERGIKLPMATIRNWLSGRSNPQGNETSRDIMFKLCFALDFTVEETAEFFSKVYLNRPYDGRNVSEAVYLFCMNHRLPYEKAEELNGRAKDILKAKKEEELKSDKIITRTVTLNDMILRIKSEHDFLAFVEINSGNFYAEGNEGILIGNRTAMKKYEELLNEAKKLLKETSTGAVLSDIYKAREQTDEAGRKITLNKGAGFVKAVQNNFPNKQTMSNIQNGDKKSTYDAIRKALILLKFYCFFKKVENIMANKDEDFEDFWYETDDMLDECGYALLYPRNPYDWIFLHCAACSHDENCDVDLYQPLDELRDIIDDMLSSEDEA